MKEIWRKSFFGLVVLFFIIMIGWQCPFQLITGFPCPGCMMTTAAYYLIHLDFKAAWYFNPAIYFLLIGGILALIFRNNHRVLRYIGIITLTIWMVSYLMRLMIIFPNWPMPYVENNIFQHIFR